MPRSTRYKRQASQAIAQAHTIAQHRQGPGLLIFSGSFTLLFQNSQGQQFLQHLSSSLPDTPVNQAADPPPTLPPDLHLFLQELSNKPSQGKDSFSEHHTTLQRVLVSRDGTVLVRGQGFSLDQHRKSRGYVVTIEPIALSRTSIRVFTSSASYHFSTQEETILSHLARGHTNQHIAQKIGLSVFTIRDYVRTLMEKTEVKSRAGIIPRILASDPSYGFLLDSQKPRKRK